jgi:hypothetical protein
MNIIKRLSLFLLTILFAFTSFCQSNNYEPTHRYSVNDLKADFQFLRITIEKTHPNLYLYTSKAEFKSFFDSLYNSMTMSLTELEFYNLITLLNSKIRDGHTMFLPSQEEMNYSNQKDKFFPFYVMISCDKLYVNMNCSPDTSITEGAELLRINGINTSVIIKQLLLRQIRDGYNSTYPVWILTNYFKEYFGFSFGHPELFSITSKTVNMERKSVINALPKDSINYFRNAKYSNRISLTDKNQGITLNIDKQLNLARLSIKSFDREKLNSIYRQDFDSTISRMFNEIDSARVDNLILDVRNNQGGDFEPGRILLSYLLRQPVRYLFGSKEAKTIFPQKNSFKGNLFTLINGGSFSSTAIVCSYLELTKRSVFIGDETAGNKVIISGDPIDITLPHTRILCEISTEKYLIRNSDNNGHGIKPDYHITPTIDDVISNRDVTMEFALKLTQKIASAQDTRYHKN